MIRYCNAVRGSVDAANPTIKRVLVYVNMNYERGLTLAETAKQFGVSRGYLAKSFKEETGDTFIEYITKLKLKKAEQLLKETDYHINDIADYCGFSDGNYFTRKFKAIYNMTPSEYRETT